MAQQLRVITACSEDSDLVLSPMRPCNSSSRESTSSSDLQGHIHPANKLKQTYIKIISHFTFQGGIEPSTIYDIFLKKQQIIVLIVLNTGASLVCFCLLLLLLLRVLI